MSHHHWMIRAGLLAMPLAGLSGCGEDAASARCIAENEVRGVCAGVPAASVCDRDFCAAGVDCARTVEVPDDAALHAAIGAATAGTCLMLAPGKYGAVILPGGVSLLGRSADAVTVAGVTLGPGNGAVLRGVAVGAGGVKVDGAMGASIASVRVSGGAQDGIEVLAGSLVTIVTSTVEGARRYGLSATETTNVTVKQSVFAKNAGAGIWAQCGNNCDCTADASFHIENSVVRGNFALGVGLLGVKSTLNKVDIVDTSGDPMQFYRGGAGLAVGSCADVDAKGLRVQRSNAYGVLIDKAKAVVGGFGADEDVEISGNRVGFWAKNIMEDPGVTLSNGLVDGNDGVGIGVSGGTRGFIICKSKVSGTRMRDLTVLQGGVLGAQPEAVGDGLVWLDGSKATIDDITLIGNARASVLINGEAEGSIKNVHQEGEENAKGMLQQNFKGGVQPVILGGAPPLSVDANEQFSVPVAPTAP